MDGIWIWIWTALGTAVLAVLLGLCWKRRERRELDLMVMRDVQAWNLPLPPPPPPTVIPIEGWDDWNDWSINAQNV